MSKDEPKELPSTGDTEPVRRREASDMFSVEPAQRQLAPIHDVPLTKEELARRRNVRIALISAAVVAIAIAAVVALHLQHRAAISSACATAESTGRLADIDAALALLEGEDGPGDVALRARLHATAVLAGEGTSGEGSHRALADALLASHDAGGEGASDHRIAATYLALADGDAERATAEASALVAGRGPRAAEAAHARALAALAVGNLEAARAAAEAAHDDLTGSPRHAALVVEVASRAHLPAPDTSADEGTPLRLARARVGLETSANLDAAQADADAVLAAADATPVERAWAVLVRALIAVEQGDTLAALESLGRAAESPPPGDELFRIELAEGFLALGMQAEADREMEALHTAISADAGRRDLLLARRALLRGDLPEAERSLGTVPAGPRRDLVEAQIHLARGSWDPARVALDRAIAAPETELPARIELSGMLLSTGRATEALAPIEALLAAHPTSPRLAAAAARVHAATGQRDRALEVLRVALEAYPREPALLLEKARVHARAAEWEPAFDALTLAAESSPRDPVILLERGLAARALGRLDVARQALRASLDLSPGEARALVALLGAELDAHAIEDARRTEAELAALALDAPDVAELRARYFVEALAGQRGVAGLSRGRRPPRAPELTLPLARLYFQAERWEDAADAFFVVAQRGDADRALALGMRAVALARARRAPTVEAVVDQLRTLSAGETIPPSVLALTSVAQGWLEWNEDALGRASIFARQALDRDPGNAHANVLLAVLDSAGRRDPSEHARAAVDVSLEARGMLGLLGELDAERCGYLRLYLEGAPEGRLAEDVRARVAGCPSAP